MTTDPYKMAVYRAEQEMRDRCQSVDRLPNVGAFVKAHSKVVNSDWWKEFGAHSIVEVSPRMFRMATTRDGYIIRVGSKGEACWSWSLLVLAHELAHVAHCRGPLNVRSIPHGAGFTGWMLTITGAIIGAEVADALADVYRRHGVPSSKPSHVTIPDAPIIGYSAPVVTRRTVDPDFAARRAARLAQARENRRAHAATNIRLSS